MKSFNVFRPSRVDPRKCCKLYNINHVLLPSTCPYYHREGLSFVLWTIRHVDHQSVLLEYVSPDGADGFPGDLIVQVRYRFSNISAKANTFELRISYKATLSNSTNKRVFCPVSLTNHTYWNLAGHRAGARGLSNHEVQIQANRYVELRPVDLIPTGRILSIPVGSPLDFRLPRPLGPGLTNLGNPDAEGYDDYYVLDCDRKPEEPAVTVTEPESGRRMRVYTDQPGLQFYTGFYLNPNSDPIGKEGHLYTPFSGFCVETEGYPDAYNQPDFPAVILESGGAPYIQETTFQFDCIWSYLEGTWSWFWRHIQANSVLSNKSGWWALVVTLMR